MVGKGIKTSIKGGRTDLHGKRARAVYVSPRAAQQLERITQPTLIVTSEFDIEACKEIADLMEQKITHSKKVVFSDSGYAMHIDRPDEFNKLILNFIGDL